MSKIKQISLYREKPVTNSRKRWAGLFVREEQEAGVPGFKVSVYDRDKLQIIRDEAIKGSFDILQVFMFDRLGRREGETPFVVE